ncbi:lipoate--protein ligase family protein [Desertifilum sp. FACHB-1129]|uniref:Biotin--protein ligase n=1 Tax=Desertifilum tharense IPPAS B-1220 TaxID=1781255 RepID=A0A1E5QEE7_9CYAN|nr:MULTISPECIES: lipoate--protein ligase family protein [Desertifilum]MDA0213413.1 lipoate--protein ligase family protein [Cyanobacteria bacterium FC1]MDI9635946.1 lipoate--protein ligase family protein [Geitlerinema splendidum]MBD2314904.1 lipoate--protein ligase family protein [Desertifilum sp. FACHB-1129]MBD2322894.1 lipoate--protein ligase family protein [Desertifilum sp. FACHB-866]MBD2335293.1 lipoate--protein ligase family protein [Desertifilum sp. FACHB-868]
MTLQIWRLIPLFVAPGAMQMAIDRWLVEQYRLGLHPPTLRFYLWQPTAISLGYHQRHWPEFWQHLKWRDRPLDLVRRPSGGRAVLHQGDLTYAIVTADGGGDRTQVYQQCCEFLIQGWRSLGVELQYGQSKRGYIHHPSCFATATAADLITPSGDKLIGSAQLRLPPAILQHGSMRLEPDPDLFAQVFETPPPPPLQLPLTERGNALIEIAIAALCQAAERCFNMQLLEQPFSEQEWSAIQTYAATRESSLTR